MPKKIVLAYSGGLDTSVILKWLQNKFGCPVVTFTADIGQGDELLPIETKAKNLGVKEIFIENLQEHGPLYIGIVPFFCFSLCFTILIYYMIE